MLRSWNALTLLLLQVSILLAPTTPLLTFSHAHPLNTTDITNAVNRSIARNQNLSLRTAFSVPVQSSYHAWSPGSSQNDARQTCLSQSLWTVQNRRLHYFLYFYCLNLTKDWLLENQPQNRANFQLAMHATHLATRSTLHFRSIKASTIA
jgi:hypothetical protein